MFSCDSSYSEVNSDIVDKDSSRANMSGDEHERDASLTLPVSLYD